MSSRNGGIKPWPGRALQSIPEPPRAPPDQLPHWLAKVAVTPRLGVRFMELEDAGARLVRHPRGGRKPRSRTLGLLAVATAVLAGSSASAQEALLSSLAYDRAVAPNQNPVANPAPDMPHLGPVQLSLGAYLGADYEDNVNYTQTNIQSDDILHAGVTLGFYWPATQQSAVSLNTSLGYAHYLNNAQYDYLEVGPNSALSWNVLFPDGSLNFFDQFSYSQQVETQASLSGVATFPIFDNTAGARINWSPSQWVFQAGYSHDNYFSDSSVFDYLNRSSEYVFTRGAWQFAEKNQAGLETSASLTSYSLASEGNSYSLSVGPYVEWQITQAIHATIRGGPTYYWFNSTTSSGQGNNLNSYYVGFQVTHQLTEFVSHQLGIERDVSLGLNQGSQYSEQLTASYSVSLALAQGIGLSVNGNYVHGNQTFQNLVTIAPGLSIPFNQMEVYDQYSVGPALSWQATDKFSTSLSYNYYLRESNLPGRGYTQDIVSLRLNYAF
jgi:hypothetical protein